MSESFLSRWSRRKRENTSPRLRGESLPSGEDPRVGSRSDPGEGASPPVVAVEKAPHPDPLPASAESEFDPASLPPIESIDASTDVSVFLRPGVPADLARAALRRAWVADPAIRDFVGPAENAWDFNAPGGVPGFEPLRAIDDVRHLAAQVAGALPAAPEAATAEEATNIAPAPQAAAAATPVPPDETGAAAVDDAAAQDDTPADHPAASPRPRHGGALAE